MASLRSCQLHPLLLLPRRVRPPNPLPNRTHFGFSITTAPSPSLHRRSIAVHLVPPRGDSPDFEGLARELFDRAEGIIYTIADAAVSADVAASQDPKPSGDWFSGITNYMETILKVLKDGLSTLHIPYAYGFAIILLTVLVKAATFPLSKKQVESALAMRSLQPQVKAIQERYAGDPERIQLETARLYKLAGVNPLAGCLPTLATIPVWIGLYRALSNVANEGLLTEGFFWIPSLAGPTTVAARQSGSGISWIFPFIDGHPPLGWPDTLAYLVLPLLLVVSQYISAQVLQPSQGTDPNQKSTQVVTKILPLMIGYFSLSVPSGLSLYWFTNNVLSTAQQIWLQKLGGAKNPVKEYSDITFKDEPLNVSPKIEKSLLDIEPEKVKSIEGEKIDSGGLRPGERFRQLKEQEARRRKQREEEEKWKAEEAAESSRGTIEQQSTEVASVQKKDEQESTESGRGLHMSASNNGGSNSHPISATKDEGSAHEKVQKEELAELHGLNGNQTSAPETLDRRDQETGGGEL